MIGLSHNGYIPIFVKVSQLVPGKNVFKGVFTIYGHGGHLGHVTNIILLNFISLYLKAYIINLVKNGPVVSEKASFNFHMLMTVDQGQEMTLILNTLISS